MALWSMHSPILLPFDLVYPILWHVRKLRILHCSVSFKSSPKLFPFFFNITKYSFFISISLQWVEMCPVWSLLAKLCTPKQHQMMRLSQIRNHNTCMNFLGFTSLYFNFSCYFNIILHINDEQGEALTLANLMNGKKKITPSCELIE